jgi:hypothetical protein
MHFCDTLLKYEEKKIEIFGREMPFAKTSASLFKNGIHFTF